MQNTLSFKIQSYKKHQIKIDKNPISQTEKFKYFCNAKQTFIHRLKHNITEKNPMASTTKCFTLKYKIYKE